MPAVKNTTSVNSQNTTLGYGRYNKCHTRIQMSTFQLFKNVRFLGWFCCVFFLVLSITQCR
ncbi:hypothetical protein, partial [Burkholderia cenocepacia]|uniref:hypothetical protein n=1 Tax=Burkholderia cenocepacia TaxID=95486 RepID=UPI001F26816B